MSRLAWYYYTCILWNKKLFFLIILFYTCHHVLKLIWWLDNLTPTTFEKHARIETCRRSKYNFWIFVDSYKAPLIKSVLFQYYHQYPKPSNGRYRCCHRDKFIKCTMWKRAQVSSPFIEGMQQLPWCFDHYPWKVLWYSFWQVCFLSCLISLNDYVYICRLLFLICYLYSKGDLF